MACEINENTVPITALEVYYDEFLGFGDSHSYSYSMSENETVTFYVNIQQQLTTPNATLRLYRIEHNGDITSLGISYLRSYRNVFEYDGTIGNYFFCLESIYSATYDLTVDFTDYNGVLMPIAEGYTGEEGFLDLGSEPAPCQLEIGYRMIDGELPKGLEFYTTGNIWGIAQEQDCESREDEVPSWNWKEITEGFVWPTAKEYFINVQAYFIKYSYVKTNKWFKVCVHNNWDLDDQRENLNYSQSVFDVSYVDVELDPTGLCPCTETREIITERIVEFSKYITDDQREQLEKLMYEKQCGERHDIPPKEDLYLEIEEDKSLPETLCPVCPDDK